jgi:ABC-type transport system involved in cytochrome bd biosynthesis fused ATPase/permease subunit
MTHRAAAVMTVNLLAFGDAVRRRLTDQHGQGTVEYVGLILLVAGVLAAVVAWANSKAGDQGIGAKVTKQLKNAIDQTSSKAGQ